MGNTWKYVEYVVKAYFANGLRAARAEMEFEDEMEVISTGNDKWVFVFAAILNTEEDGGLTRFVIDLYAWDLLNEARSNTVDVVSNTHAILRDFHKWLSEDGDQYITIEDGSVPRIEALNNGLLDIAAGNVLRGLVIEVASVDYCDIPGLLPPYIEPDCPPVLLTNSDGSYTEEVPAGEEKVLPDVEIQIEINGKPRAQVSVPANKDETINIRI